MHPVFFHIGPLTVYSYGLLVAAGVILGLWVARRQARHAGLNPERVWNLGVYVVLAGILGAKLWFVVLYAGYYRANPGELLSLTVLQSGGAFYGSFLAAIVLLVAYARFSRTPLLPLLDTFGVALPIGHALGRVGCFLAGCCYGKPTGLPWGVVFTNRLAGQIAGTPLGIRLHPTQLYEAVLEGLNFVFLLWLGRRQRFAGEIAGAYLLLYGLERGLLEFLRGDPDRTLLFHDAISLMQIVSVGLVLAGAWLLWRGMRRAPLAVGGEVTGPGRQQL